MLASQLGKMPTESVRRRISRLRRSLGLLDQICCTRPSGETGGREDVRAGSIEVLEHIRKLLLDVVQELSTWALTASASGSLPDRAGQVGHDRHHQALVRVGGDQADPAEAAGDEVGEERVPRCPGLAGRDSQAADFAAPIGVDAGRDTTALMTRPPLRTFMVSASAATNVDGPALSGGRCRNWSMCSSSSAAIRDTCGFDSEWIPRVLTSLSILRVDRPAM